MSSSHLGLQCDPVSDQQKRTPNTDEGPPSQPCYITITQINGHGWHPLVHPALGPVSQKHHPRFPVSRLCNMSQGSLNCRWLGRDSTGDTCPQCVSCMYMCIYVCAYIYVYEFFYMYVYHMCAWCPCSSRLLDPLQLELRLVVRNWVLEIEPINNCWAPSPDLLVFVVICLF